MNYEQLLKRLEEINAPADVKKLAMELCEQALRDPLTGLFNRRFFEEALDRQIEVARRYQRDLSLVLFDLDDLKKTNDSCGHSAGDEVLREFAQVIQRTVRKADIVCRIGGDEFAVLLPETPLSNASNFTSRFLSILKKSKIRASIGIAALPSENLFAEADAELLHRKRKKKE
jgi:diguanylate cyclase (GGDEF)-like protein